MHHAHILTGNVCLYLAHQGHINTNLWEYFSATTRTGFLRKLWPLIYLPQLGPLYTLEIRTEPFALVLPLPFPHKLCPVVKDLFIWDWDLPHRSHAPGPLSAEPHHVPLATSPASRCTPSCSSLSPGYWLLQILIPFLLPYRKTERLWCLLTQLTIRHNYFRWINYMQKYPLHMSSVLLPPQFIFFPGSY